MCLLKLSTMVMVTKSLGLRTFESISSFLLEHFTVVWCGFVGMVVWCWLCGYNGGVMVVWC